MQGWLVHGVFYGGLLIIYWLIFYFLLSSAPFFVECISEQDLDEMNIEIIRNTLYKANILFIKFIFIYLIVAPVTFCRFELTVVDFTLLSSLRLNLFI